MASFYITLEVDNVEEDASYEDIAQNIIDYLKDGIKFIDINLVEVGHE